jgi:DNA-binding NarL/FixJ family response regulator
MIINVAIVEDDDTIRNGILQYLKGQNNIICEFAEDSVESLLKKINYDEPPDVVLMDIELPGMSGINGIKILKERIPEINIIMLTIFSDTSRIFNSLCAGASGYLLKNTPLSEIKSSIEVLYNGGSPMSPEIARKVIQYFNPKDAQKYESPLTQKEHEIVSGLVEGLSYKMIADKMNISIETVRFHIKNIYKKLHVNSKGEVISKSLKGEI